MNETDLVARVERMAFQGDLELARLLMLSVEVGGQDLECVRLLFPTRLVSSGPRFSTKARSHSKPKSKPCVVVPSSKFAVP
jgi:hypothetical protein